MATRYSADFLLHLRQSPLCTRPANLPPAEEWMGQTLEQLQRQNVKPSNDRPRTNDLSLLDQANRRPGLDRHVARNSANPDDIVFGPPRMAFSSARGNKAVENDKSGRDSDSPGRITFRNRGDNDGDRFRDGRSNPARRRGDGDQDGDGWNMVKPRKSFGAEGAERFHGKMGGNFREERRPTRDTISNKDDRENGRERPARPFDGFTRDKDAADTEGRPPRNGLNRNKADNWRTTESNEAPPMPEKRDRDRTKSWRDRDRDAEPSDDRGAGRNNDRRWGRDRDQRNERDPEWLDEPADAREAHTQQDFQKWMEQMKKAKSGSSSSAKATDTPAEPPKPSLPVAPVETGPDKFFLAFGGTSASTDVTSPSEPKDSASSKSKTSGKSSRFTSFFSQPQGDSRPRTEASTPLAGPPVNGPGSTAGSAPVPPGVLAALLGSVPSQEAAHSGAPDEERQAFQSLLAKLQKQSVSATPPGPSPFAAPPQSKPLGNKNSMGSPEPLHQYGAGPRDASLGRPPSQQPHQEILAPRPQQSARPEQLLQDLAGHHQRVSSQGSTNRAEPNAARNNSNTEFLMNLMRMAPDAHRPDQGRVASQSQPQIQKHSPLPPFNDREQEFPGRENRNNERALRPQPPPGFPMDESFHGLERESRQAQPTQILQRPPPPGLDQMPPNWMAGAAQMPPPQQRGGPMLPPPGLAGGLGGPGGPNRNMPMPPMFPPNFPPGAMPPPPPEAMGGMPPRNMPPPPPGFFSGPPPHGFLPPGLGGFNGPPPGPEGFGGPPFETRGMPPSAGNNGRGAAYGRP
ncbi:hypothetical protein H634G_06133 [Metarhizium anisopliae BRIP 53293]|uniref:Uncharacterized protein n=1 Tax=Metarhizium anisopliae BRIP 53293 TaxID=1291518 RepID=A0A0D9P0S6_METAN|nr:hypothetical protein H634G_06133 [Metarhizium anisopliae BRIP 53293]KJK95651.1 hypothetical protein H633G_00471 [Metarhizium anisopliae BRIP 53284]